MGAPSVPEACSSRRTRSRTPRDHAGRSPIFSPSRVGVVSFSRQHPVCESNKAPLILVPPRSMPMVWEWAGEGEGKNVVKQMGGLGVEGV